MNKDIVKKRITDTTQSISYAEFSYMLIMGYDYYPLDIGNWWIYEVDSVVYDTKGQSVVKDSIHVMVREEIVDTFSSSVDGLSYKIERSQLNIDSNWVISDIWWVNKDNEKVLRTEDNLTFIKLVFPTEALVSWDGNAFIDSRTELVVRKDILEHTFVGWDYTYLFVDVKETINGLNFDKVLTVDASLPKQLGDIEWRSTKEKYARGVGLVYKQWELLDLDINRPRSLPVYERANEGFLMVQKLVNYSVK